ncbi:DUF4870 domain-containing protein [Nonomuraea cavernae]|uniref:DUF4870 domain-containing protein n=1 Tax=Nonomuraea cavernae TaxID=2045107 RepID=A0A917YT38_9ACTN|nr:DUF4870 domain-containing protein [Nonomuraea cavernae]MCA2185364.1 DUF4870 domain-containing protein [Nonomuraea cavernae]GGO66245.1 hypothetical protein GCM10012289_19790 [Nonomuraea cavernae]
MSQDPPQQQPDDDATRRISQSDIPPQGSGPQGPYQPQPGSAPGYQPQPGFERPGHQPPADQWQGYQQQPGSSPEQGYGYGQPPTPPPGYQQPGYGYQQHPGQGYGAPQQRPPHVPGRYGPRPGSDDTTMAMLAHLLGLLVSWVGPLIIYLMKKDESPYVRDQAAEALNFQITMFIGYMVAGLLTIVLIGLLLLPVVWIVSLIFHIQAAIAANKGENYRYPIAIRLVS